MAVSIDGYKTQSEPMKSKLNMVEKSYGDGYIQRTVVGINPERETINVTFEPLDSTSSLTLKNILVDSVRSTSNILTFTPIGETESNYYIAKEVNKNPMGSGLFQISCTLEKQVVII